MAANDDGTKVVVFGGRLDNGMYARDLWVLDVPNLQWTQGPSWMEPRISAACTVAGSTFVSWGGSNGQRTVDSTVILYDLNRGQYITSYTPPPEFATNNIKGFNGNGADRKGSQYDSDANGPFSDEKRKSSSSTLIVGGIIGSVLLVACVTLVSVFVRKHRQKIQSQCIRGYGASLGQPRPSMGQPRTSIGQPRPSVGQPRPSMSNSLGVNTLSKKQSLADFTSPRDTYSIDEEKEVGSITAFGQPTLPRSPPATVTSPTMVRQSEDSLATHGRSQWQRT
ncbi:hypothetical protein B0O80DRAFT_28609 [Mortierella sp. GBAus27b]|nr:hypothetical protein B0O80DRAFT_28609 [Mortierella sp. GBAus27b]